jgi:HEAT repeat protein
MVAVIVAAVALALAASPGSERKPNPFAPSLPLLTDEEEEQIDRVIDQFILVDTGKLRGEEGKAALRAFEKLGPEAIPALIRGLNRAARIEHSCPATVIAKRLHRMFLGSRDTQLLEFARDEIGAGVSRSRHKALLADLRVACTLHRNALLRAGVVPPRSIRSMTTAELAGAATREQGARLKEVLTTLEQRRGPEVLDGLGRAAGNPDKDVQQQARELLDQHLYRQTVPSVKKSLAHEQAEVRRAAARLVGLRMPALGGDLIDLLADPEADVRRAAHQALVLVNKGEDLGPPEDADAVAREAAIQKWRQWWDSALKRR